MSNIVSSLKLNGYPKAFIHSSRISSSVAPTSTPECRAVAVIPYVQGVSECLKRVFTPLQIRVCFKSFLTLQQMLSKPKDQVPDLQRSGVVYSIHCACCPKVYIGQTGRRLSQRLTEQSRWQISTLLHWLSMPGLLVTLSTGRTPMLSLTAQTNTQDYSGHLHQVYQSHTKQRHWHFTTMCQMLAGLRFSHSSYSILSYCVHLALYMCCL